MYPGGVDLPWAKFGFTAQNICHAIIFMPLINELGE